MDSSNNTHNRLQTVFQTVFGDDNLTIFPEMTANDVEEWDSMMHINLIVACEREFRIKFAISEIADLPNVGALEALIARKIS
jgi:acyl carrier protein